MFGQYVNTTQSGLNFWFPWPIGSVSKPNVEKTNQINVGFRSLGSRGRVDNVRDVREESLMLTGDQNIIDIDYVVQWRISNARDFLFNIRDPEHDQTRSELDPRNRRPDAAREALATKRTESDRADPRRASSASWTTTRLACSLPTSRCRRSTANEVIDAFNDVQRARQDRSASRGRSRGLSQRHRAEGQG